MPLIIRGAREVPGRHYNTPKELWGFHLPPASGSPAAVATRVLHANAARLGLDGVIDSLSSPRVVQSVAAWHVIFAQEYKRRLVHRAYVTVHMTRQKSVYLIKNRAVPRARLPVGRDRTIAESHALSLARRSIRRRATELVVRRHPFVWFPLRTKLHLAYKFRLLRANPREEWIVYVDAVSGAILSKYNNLAEANGRARVFDPNPVVTLGDWRPLLPDGVPIRRVPEAAYRSVRLSALPRSGILNGPRVNTSRTNNRIRRRSLDFRVLSHEPGFEEVMVYFHVDRAIRYVESLGYRAKRRVFRAPLEADARATRDDNSWYSPGTRSLGFGTGDVDDAEDGETILHEFGHALQDAICPDFGQSAEAAAMGEGFGDYFAASFFARTKQDRGAAGLLPAVMTWDGILCDGGGETGPPCVRRLDSGVTYESFDHSDVADEHLNGEIWSATLWEIWQAVGREVADRIIIESHFQLDGFTTFAKGARAILDADRHMFRGRHVRRLLPIFRRRGIGPVE